MSVIWQNIPNRITTLRLLMVPILWLLAVTGYPIAVGLGLAICGFSDWLDGVLARRLNQTSASGAKYDSIVDQTLLLSTVAWVIMLRPELFRENQAVVILALSIYLLSLLVGLAKFHRVANLHLRLSRWTAYALYALLVHTFMAERYSLLLLLLACTMFTLSSLETLILQLISPQVDEHMGSLFQVLRRRQEEQLQEKDVLQERSR